MSRTLSLWTLASRTRHMNASAIREILKPTERPGIISRSEGLRELA